MLACLREVLKVATAFAPAMVRKDGHDHELLIRHLLIGEINEIAREGLVSIFAICR